MIQREKVYNTEQLISLRRKLHANPELSGQEKQTAQMIVEELKQLKPDWIKEKLGGYGVLAAFGAGSGPSILFRAELDALPIHELNEFEYKSAINGMSHKCGHDGHMAILLNLADQIDALRQKSQLLFLFQPAEETGEGARAILNERHLAQSPPDYCFALHNMPGYPLGALILKKGNFTAAVKSLIIKLNGRTAHAAEPEFGINPAMAIAAILQYLNGLNQPNPLLSSYSVITPIHLNMGEKAYGISAGYGEVHITIRSWTEAQMQVMVQKIMKALDMICEQHQLELTTEWTNEFSANFNDDHCVEIVNLAAKRLQMPVIYEETPFKFGEDFGAITQQYRGCMFGIGSGEQCPVLHNPYYDFPDELIPLGANLFRTIAELTLELD